MVTEKRKPLPKISEVTAPFWAGCKRHELLIQHCAGCGTYRFPPQPMCRKCNSMKYDWSKVDGKGKIFSYMTVPGFHPRASPMGYWPLDGYPINVVIVELAGTGGVRIVSNLVGCSPGDMKIGLPVEVVFEDINEQVTLPKFKLA